MVAYQQMCIANKGLPNVRSMNHTEQLMRHESSEITNDVRSKKFWPDSLSMLNLNFGWWELDCRTNLKFIFYFKSENQENFLFLSHQHSHELLAKFLFSITQLINYFLTNHIWVWANWPIYSGGTLDIWRSNVNV